MGALSFVILGLSITSSWGNGHATTYRSLARELRGRDHEIVFLERDVPWYAANRDMPEPPFARACLYHGVADLKRRFTGIVRTADVVIVGSFVPDGHAVAEWVLDTAGGVTAFYDIDTPETVAALERGTCAYLSADLVPAFDLYLSFTGGPLLRRLEHEFGARMARPLYCSVDPDLYYPAKAPLRWDLGYLGTYSADRQPKLARLLIEPARTRPSARFVVAGPQYPDDIAWPRNVARITHLAPNRHRRFFNAQRFTLNITRANMVRAGWSPSVRLFEAAACGSVIISDWWEGLDSLFAPGKEILVAQTAREIMDMLDIGEAERRRIGQAARARFLLCHTARHRAQELERYVREAGSQLRPSHAAAMRAQA
ncbi:MAG TPA: glycosyltransferase [Alphaproteobacteria bacterium]